MRRGFLIAVVARLVFGCVGIWWFANQKAAAAVTSPAAAPATVQPTALPPAAAVAEPAPETRLDVQRRLRARGFTRAGAL